MAQQRGKIFRVGCMPGGPLAARQHQWEAFRRSLHDLGWVEGRNIAFEFRVPAKEGDPYDDLARDLVQQKVDVIVVTGSRGVHAVKRATSTIPIVMSPATNPVGEGFIATFARPGANITGVTIMVEDTSGKRLELLREIVPDLRHVAVLASPASDAESRAVEQAAASAGLQTTKVHFSKAQELEQAFATARNTGAQAVFVLQTVVAFGLRDQMVGLAAKHRLPAVYSLATFVRAGGLVSYGPSDTEYYRRAARYVDAILRGARPAELPVEQPSKFELTINVRSAKAAGITVPNSLIVRADELVQ